MPAPTLSTAAPVATGRYLRLRRQGMWLVVWLVSFLGGTPGIVSAADEEVKVWEFSPYAVKVWYAFDASINLSPLAQRHFVAQLDQDLQRAFQAAWSLQVEPLSPDLAGGVIRNFENFTLEDVSSTELSVVIADSVENRSIRTLEAALDSFATIHCSDKAYQRLQVACEQLRLTDNSLAQRLLAKCVVDTDGPSAVSDKMQSGTATAALLPQASVLELGSAWRPLLTPLPWQTDSLFREQDKVFFLLISRRDGQFTVRARELDCPMRFLGPSMQADFSQWYFASRMATATTVRAFAPVARVEDAQRRSATLRLRAGGLIVDDSNPASMRVGDVLQPFVRRDNRNGQPELLQSVPWTFAAVTASDGVTLQSNVYSYSNGPGLEGRKNRRTERVVMRVRPRFAESDVRVVVRGTERAQAGCFVYRHDLITQEFELLGRTDWRGRFTIAVPEDFGYILPEAVRYERAQAKREAEAKADIAAQEATSASGTPQVSPSELYPPPEEDPAAIHLNYPLIQLVVKSGDKPLGLLSMVPGLEKIETAGLQDDSARLKTEAFVRGFQGEVLDLIGLRNLLAARIRLHLKNNQPDKAAATLEELRRLRNYNEMTDQLEAIQRRMLEESGDSATSQAKAAIDRMFQTTRDMLQKYMQDNLLDESERLVKQSQSAS